MWALRKTNDALKDNFLELATNSATANLWLQYDTSKSIWPALEKNTKQLNLPTPLPILEDLALAVVGIDAESLNQTLHLRLEYLEITLLMDSNSL